MNHSPRISRQRGFTLTEIAITLVAATVLFAAIARYAFDVHSQVASVEATLRQRQEAGLAFDYLGRDLREATRVTAGDGTLDLAGPRGAIHYEARTVLARSQAGATSVLARGLEKATFSLRPEGCFVQLSFFESLGRFKARTAVERLLVRPGRNP